MLSTDPNEIVATNVRRLRLARGWSQETLAEQCGLHRTYIGAIERGEGNITLHTLARLAQALECGCDVLIRERKGTGKK